MSGIFIKFFLLLILTLWAGTLCAQTFDTEFYPSETLEGPQMTDIDDHIFYTPAWNAADPFRDLSRYRFGAVRYRERGLDSRHRKVYLGGIDLSDNISPYPDYTLISLLWKKGLSTYSPAMITTGVPAGIGYSEHYSMKARTAEQVYVSLRAMDRSSRAGVDARQNLEWKNGWSHSLTVSGRYGADGHIKGIRSDEAGGALSVTKSWGNATERWEKNPNLTLFIAGNISERGLRTAATDETFELTGDKLYNPSWGRQDGEVRNSRQRNVRQIFAAASFETPLAESRMLTFTAAFRRSHNGQTRLAWYDTHSPLPDYYRKMPSYFPDWSAAGIITDAWHTEDPSVTQVDWTELYYANTLSHNGHATYILEEQVELSSDMHFNLGLHRRVSPAFEISYGIRVRRDRSRFFKLADDMLGAEYVLNIDQYVTDDQGDYYTGQRNENDLRNPGRMVREGARFGYDYAVMRWKPSVYGTVDLYKQDYGVSASASLTYTGMQRKGYYEKELFPGNASFGKSKTAGFTTYSLGASAYWNVSIRNTLSVSALASTEAPFAGDIFLSPKQNNHLIVSPKPMGIYGAELSWSFTGKNIDLRVSGFLNTTTNETDVRQYYDDLSSTFCNMVVRGMDKLSYGIEVGVDIKLSRYFTLTAGGSAGEYRYNSEPTATVYADADNSVISEGIKCYLSGIKLGPPQTVAAVTLTYSDFNRWRVSLSAEYMGNRYVDINPLYHSSRIVGINSAPEIMNRFNSQERLPDAFTLGLSVSKGFVLKKGYLRVAGSVRNLLSSDIIYSGYEQMRIMRQGSGINRTLVPFPSKYLYSYPLTWSFALSYSL